MRYIFNSIVAIIACMAAVSANAAGKVVPIRYGNMDRWTIRKVSESGVIGGDTKTLYEIGPNRTISGNKPYVNGGGSPWATSNVMAKVMGVVKAATLSIGAAGARDGLPN